jgi:hypothetical protein
MWISSNPLLAPMIRDPHFGRVFPTAPQLQVIHNPWGYPLDGVWISKLSPSTTTNVDKLWFLWITSRTSHGIKDCCREKAVYNPLFYLCISEETKNGYVINSRGSKQDPVDKSRNPQ